MTEQSVRGGDDRLPVAGRARVRGVVLRLIRQHRSAYAGVTVLAAGASLAGLVGPYAVGQLVQVLGNAGDPGVIPILCLMMLAAVTVQAVLTAFSTRFAMVLGERIFAQLREDFLEQATALPISVVERAGTGDLLTRTTTDIDSVSMAVRFAIPKIVVSTIAVAITLIAAFVTSPQISSALLVGVPALVVVVRWYVRRARWAYLGVNEAYDDLFGAVAQTLDGARTVDALALGPNRIDFTDAVLGGLWRRRRRIVQLKMTLLPISALAYTVPIPLCLLWGGVLAANGLSTVGAVTTVTLYAVQLTAPIVAVVQWLDNLQRGFSSLARILGVGEINGDRRGGDARPATSSIQLSGASYRYADGPLVLHEITLELIPGERLAIVGPSGAGKTTIGRLLAGIDTPTVGTATVGGVSLTDLSVSDLRQQVALVTQEHHVFVATVSDNVRLGKPEASDQEVLHALDVVGAGEWVSKLPDGLDTIVGSGGYSVSAPDAQRIALARLILVDPHTLVLDEATSVLDARSARSIELSLAALLVGRTVVSIAHRLHTAYDADRIAVVEAGRIIELGSHEALLSAGGTYARLWAKWTSDA